MTFPSTPVKQSEIFTAETSIQPSRSSRDNLKQIQKSRYCRKVIDQHIEQYNKL